VIYSGNLDTYFGHRIKRQSYNEESYNGSIHYKFPSLKETLRQ